jgi:serine/threonine-protein kinase
MLMLSPSATSLHHPVEVTSGGESYRPLLELGRGGMARVYLAERTARGLRKLVVLKVLDPSLATDPEMRAAFRREAELCARLNHPNIVQVFEVLDEIAAPMMVMEYVEGVSLSQILSRTDGRLPLRLHIHIVMQVLAGLQYFHELKDNVGNAQRPVHRDVSPQNVLVMHEGVVKVLDFGIAKLRDAASPEVTQAGIIKGKLAYMPGEQVAGDMSIDRRADIFAAGVMLWEGFARKRMWQGWQQNDVVRALVAGQIPNIREACPWISQGWEAIINRATAGRREERFDTALDMQIAMEECLSEVGGPVPQRELATFMATEFGEWRLERQQLVDAEMSKPAIPLASVLGGTLSSASRIQITHTPATASGSIDPQLQSSAKRRPFISVVVVLLLMAAAAVAATQLMREKSAPPAPAAIVKRINFSLVAAPNDAQILIDGKPVPQNPWTEVVPASSATRMVEVRAPGYQSYTKTVALNSDVELSVRLEPLPAAPIATASAAAAPSSSSTKSSGRIRWAAGIPRSSAAPADAAAAAKANCNPPYTLDSDGVKTYKPECF